MLLAGLGLVLATVFFGVTLWNFLNPSATGVGDPSASPSPEPSYHQADKVPEPDPNPPELPYPATKAESVEWTKANAVYAQGVPSPTNCPLTPVKSAGVSAAELEAQLNSLTACLWTVWEPPLTSSGFRLPRPPVTVYTTELTTPCGKTLEYNAFYCPANQQVYYDLNMPERLPSAIRSKPFIVEAIMAHEFGHVVQARTGLLIAEYSLEKKSPELLGFEYRRRLELQAECFAGSWLNAIAMASKLSEADVANIKAMDLALGTDEPSPTDDHGTGKSQAYWLSEGLGSPPISNCNTFAAAADQVR